MGGSPRRLSAANCSRSLVTASPRANFTPQGCGAGHHTARLHLSPMPPGFNPLAGVGPRHALCAVCCIRGFRRFAAPGPNPCLKPHTPVGAKAVSPDTDVVSVAEYPTFLGVSPSPNHLSISAPLRLPHPSSGSSFSPPSPLLAIGSTHNRLTKGYSIHPFRPETVPNGTEQILCPAVRNCIQQLRVRRRYSLSASLVLTPHSLLDLCTMALQYLRV